MSARGVPVHLHSVIVSYRRRSLTERVLDSYLATVSVPYSLVIVDNGSPKGVTDWIKGTGVDHLLLGENWYPGYATNRGWELMPPETSLLQRIDNDTEYLPGWCDEMIAAFEDPKVGQYGPIGESDEPWITAPGWPVGGNSVIARRLYDEGLRYSERPWGPDGIQEDHQLTLDVWGRGFRRVFGSTPGIRYMTGGGTRYYAETRQVRGLV